MRDGILIELVYPVFIFSNIYLVQMKVLCVFDRLSVKISESTEGLFIPHNENDNTRIRLSISKDTPRDRLDGFVNTLKRNSDQQIPSKIAVSPQIAFLIRYGIPIDRLIHAEKRGQKLNISPERVLISQGVITEDIYLDLFAEEFGYERVTPATRIILNEPFGDATRHRMAKIRPAIAVNNIKMQDAAESIIVPESNVIKYLMSNKARKNCSKIQIASSSEFQSLILADASGTMLDEITHINLKKAGQVSASSRLSNGHKIVFLMMAFITMLFVLFWPKAGSILLSICAGLAFLGIICLRLAAMLAHRPLETNTKKLDDGDLPIYTVLIALHFEDRVVSKLCKSLLGLDYPKEKLDIKFLLESSDSATRHAIELQNLPEYFTILNLPEGMPKTKPRALNAGLIFARGELVCIFDAEDEPEPDQLRKAAERFAESDQTLACLQASLVPDNVDDGILQGLFALEYATLFDVIKNGLSNLGLPMPLGGTSNHFRRSALESAGGWDAWNVTEDAELGLRFARLGLRIERLQSSTFEEAPPSIKAWFNQRRRWSKGWMQTAIAHSTEPLENIKKLGYNRFMKSLLVITGTILCILMFPIGFFAFALRCMNGTGFFSGGVISSILDGLTLVVAVLGFLAMFIPSALALKQRKLQRLWLLVPLIPIYLAGITLASWVAAFDLMVRPFHWIKTEHGFAKTSNRKRGSASV